MIRANCVQEDFRLLGQSIKLYFVQLDCQDIWLESVAIHVSKTVDQFPKLCGVTPCCCPLQVGREMSGDILCTELASVSSHRAWLVSLPRILGIA
jgi:hypothetical protein